MTAESFLSPLRRYLSNPRRNAESLRRRSRARDSANILDRVVSVLEGFSGSLEGVFLETGRRLADLQLRAREIAGQTASMAEFLSDDEGSLTLLDGVLKAAGEDHEDHRIVATVGGIQENVQAIHRAIESFDRLVNTFDVLSMMTRIESARFEAVQGSFVGLADAVMALSRQIRQQIGATSGSAKALLETTSEAGEQVRRVAQTRRENLGPLARQTRAGIQEIVSRHTQVSQANTRLAARFEGISRAIGDLVAALQSHDIVSQQVEHVLDALRRLDPRGGDGADVEATARLQAAQLDNSRATFEKSTAQIRSALASIEQNIGEMAGDAASLLGSPDANAESFASGVESSLAAILAVMDSNGDADRRLREAVISVDRRVAEISQAIGGVQSIGIEMQRIALNATIQAAHLGAEGSALEIVAGAVQGLAREAGTAAAAIADRLNGIRDAALDLDQAAAGRGSAGQIPQLRSTAAALKSIQEQARNGYFQTVGNIEQLKRQVGETLFGFRGQGDALERLASAAQRLRELSSAGGPSIAPDAERIAAAYTMQSERAVHNVIYGNAAQVQKFPLPDASPMSPEDQDDNVEFF